MLTDQKIRNLEVREKAYKVADGFGLFLVVSPNGNKHWRFKYRFGVEKSLSLGKYPRVGLTAAREIRIAAEKSLKDNIDPSLKRKIDRQTAVSDLGNTFRHIATEWHESVKCGWTARHAIKVWQRLEIHMFPVLGTWPINQIKPRDLLSALRKIESIGATETAHRTLWTCNQIFKYAVVIGATENNPAANISPGLKPHRGAGFPVLSINELPGFLRRLETVDVRKTDKLATKLLLLTVLRTGELRRCKWSDIRPSSCELRVRPEVMKVNDGFEHIVPLSSQSISALGELFRITGHQEWLFPNPVPIKNPFMQENTINRVIDEMGYKGRIVGHAFRKLFSTVLNEHEFNPDAIERQLAHIERNKVRAAYNHAKYLSARREIMQWWADYLDNALLTLNEPSAGVAENIELFLLNATQPSRHLALPA